MQSIQRQGCHAVVGLRKDFWLTVLSNAAELPLMVQAASMPQGSQ